MDVVNSVVGYINPNGGFTIIVWYRRGVITDKILVYQKTEGKTAAGNNGNQMDAVQVDNGEANFHFHTYCSN